MFNDYLDSLPMEQISMWQLEHKQNHIFYEILGMEYNEARTRAHQLTGMIATIKTQITNLTPDTNTQIHVEIRLLTAIQEDMEEERRVMANDSINLMKKLIDIENELETIKDHINDHINGYNYVQI